MVKSRAVKGTNRRRVLFWQGTIAAVLALGVAVPSTWHNNAQAAEAVLTKSAALPKSVDLRTQFRQWGLPIKPQGRRDTCAVFTLTGALEFALAQGTGERGLRLSEEYLNWAADDITQIKFDGATYEDLISAFDKWGICAERFLPYDSRYNAELQPSQNSLSSAKEIWELGFKRHWIVQRTENGLSDPQILSMKRVLSSGWPLCAYGRDHSILLVGFQDDPRLNGGGQFITRNSATQRYETIFYAAAKAEFGSVLWIDLPGRKSEPG